ncbi:hypothetical protein LWI28_016829 [Acer negundo]|uniref:Uncharacterized protein n=1 Tax=Acer negundo TaxID=4023 RepID=A0AAD5NJN2_ACENE|nr:hypothetical protein LWI28_016829 [Acer negundo]
MRATRSSKLKSKPGGDNSGNTRKEGWVDWNLEEEIAKVIEKGVALGLDLKSRGSIIRKTNQQQKGPAVSNTSQANNVIWDLEEEIAKLMETRVALGFDFNGNENEIIEVVSSREKEDEERMEDLE